MGFQLTEGGGVFLLPAETLDNLDRRPKAVKRGDLENVHLLYIPDTLIGVLVEQGINDGPGGFSIFSEVILLADIVCPLFAGEGLLPESNMTYQIKGIKLLAYFLRLSFKEDTFLLQFVDDYLLLLCLLPPAQEIVQGGKFPQDTLFGIVPE
jgi:hypothetical protein